MKAESARGRAAVVETCVHLEQSVVLPRSRWIHAPRAADLEPNASQRRAGADASEDRRDPRLGVGPARPRNPKNHQTATAPLLRGLRRARRRLRRRRAAAGEPRVPLRPRRRRDLHARVQDLPVALRRLSTNLQVRPRLRVPEPPADPELPSNDAGTTRRRRSSRTRWAST